MSWKTKNILQCVVILLSHLVIIFLIGVVDAEVVRQRSGSDGADHLVVLVNTPVGDIEGRSRTVTLPEGNQHRVDAFLGIPFAEPPVGKLRFMKPVRKSHLGFGFKALEESKACPQNPFVLKQWVPGPEGMSEDCLKLNVYVPKNDQTCSDYVSGIRNPIRPLKAVMVWIHGGAFLIGQSRIYNGERLAAFGDVIVVTINYRLGPLGFLSTGDGVVRGNAGLWDQAEAISWVSENIGAFGGDPKQVTVFGESAGASSAVFQAMFPGNDGKISGIIASSGTPLCPWTFSREPTSKYTLRMARRLGCVSNDSPGFSVAMHRSMITCLQGKSYKDIIENSFVGDLNETLFRPEFVPIVDGEFITSLPMNDLGWNQMTQDGKQMQSASLKAFSHVDAMFGNNYNDGEAIAKVSVRMYLNQTTGLDFDDSTLNQTIVENVYIPKIIEDLISEGGNLTSMDKNDIMSKLHDVYFEDNDQNRTSSSRSNQKLSQRDSALDTILDVTSDYEFIVPTIQTISSHKAAQQFSPPSPSSRGSFLFLFDRKYPYNPSFDWVRHASHGDDLPYIFGFPDSMSKAFRITDDIEKAEWGTSAVIMTYWTNFAKTGNPNLPRQVPTRWAEFDPKTLDYLYIVDSMARTNARHGLFQERIELWKSIVSPLDKNTR